MRFRRFLCGPAAAAAAAVFNGMSKRRLFGVRVIIQVFTWPLGLGLTYYEWCREMSQVRTAICMEEIWGLLNSGTIMIIGNNTGTTSIVVTVCADDTVFFVLVFDSKGVALPVGCPIQGEQCIFLRTFFVPFA